jgi:hypothetical protein
MKWPFARHPPRAAPPTLAADGAVPARREWATLPPMKSAGERPITLTAAPRAFVDGLATQRKLVHSPRLEHVRHVDAPSGSLRGVLTKSDTPADGDDRPTVREPSPLPSVEHRRVTSVPTDRDPSPDDRPTGLSPIDQLLAVGSPAEVASQPVAAEPRLPAEPFVRVVQPEGGRRSGLADSRRRGLGPAYHGPLPEAINAERERAAAPHRPETPAPSDTLTDASAVTTEPVPDGMRATMRDVLGVDVGDRLVHRGPTVSAEAQAMGAEAFTRDGQIFVADTVGPLDELRGRATLAHELTHAAQQVVQGIVSDEASVAGRMNEAHARRVEQYVRGDGGALKPSAELLHAHPSVVATPQDADLVTSTRHMMRELVDTGLARPDGDGGIVFTMPPSSMTAVTGTQRLTSSAPAAEPGAAARQENWNGGEVFGNTLAQGLSNDLVGVAGSVFGFSDEFVGEQRSELADANREFGREQTKRAFADLRMDHLRAVELDQRNAAEALRGIDRSMSLDDDTLRSIDRRVHDEVERRMRLLDDQRDRALHQLNEARRANRETLLTEIPDESYDAAFHQLFDHPEMDEVPSEDELLTVLKQSTGSPLARAGGARTTGGPPGAPSSTTRDSTRLGSTAGSSPGSTPSSRESATASPGPAHSEEPDQPWRTNETMGGRFQALGIALLGDVANDQIENIGSVFGFDQQFEQSIHDDIDASTRGSVPTSPNGESAAHSDVASAAARTGATATAAAQPDAQQTVDQIAGDPYALDELATRLYPNIRSRLRHELLIDRERAGLLADFR